MEAPHAPNGRLLQLRLPTRLMLRLPLRLCWSGWSTVRCPCCAAEAYELGEKGALSLRCRDGGGLAPDDAPTPGDGTPRGLRFFGAELAELASLGGLLGRLVGGS